MTDNDITIDIAQELWDNATDFERESFMRLVRENDGIEPTSWAKEYFAFCFSSMRAWAELRRGEYTDRL